MTDFPPPDDAQAEAEAEPIDPVPPRTDLADASPNGPADPNAGPSDPNGPNPPGGYAPGYGAVNDVRRLYRSRHDRKLGGVSAGIAEYFRIDPTVVRLAMALFFLTGVGVLVYLAAWLIVPQRPEGFVEPMRSAPVANERTMTLAFGIAALALAFGIVTGSWAVLAIALIGGGVWLLSEHTAVAPGVPSAAHAAGMATSPPSPPGGYAQMSYVQAPYAPAPLPVRERPPQRITWIVLSSLALLASIGIAAASGEWWDVSATRFLGIGIVIIGAGIVVGQFRGGGARGLIPLAILAALTLFPVSAVDGLIGEGVGEATYRPATIADLEDSYEHGVGKLVVDLSELDFEGRSESVDIGLGIGELIVIVSQETGGQAVLQAKAGEISHYLPQTNSLLFEEGVNIETGTVRLEGSDGTLDLNIKVGLGTAELRSEDN